MKNIRKHILFLPRWYPNRYDEMWGLFVRKHAEAVSLVNDVSVLYLHADDKAINDEWVEQSEGALYTLCIYYHKPPNKIKYFIKFISLYIKAINYIRKKREVDLIHVHILSRMGLLARITSFFKSTPYIITEHWSRYLPNVNTYNGALRKQLTKRIVRTAKAVMPVTSNLKSAMQNHGLKNSNYQIVPNVVDDLFFKAKLKRETPKRIIHVSTFEDKSKNISGIIDAIFEIKKTRIDFKMVFIGDGMDYERMVEKVNKLELEKHIVFTGLLEKEALVQEYERAAFMLINSNYENMPVVINEAFAVGLPVLSTNVGGISEHLCSERGRLIKPARPQQLVEQINWMLDHHQEFDSSKIREYARNHFSMAAVGQQINDVYESVLKNL